MNNHIPPPDVVRRGRAACEFYVRLLHEGQSESIARMLACRSAPGLKGTEQAFSQGRLNGQDLDKMEPDNRSHIVKAAKDAGVSVSGKVYVPGLCRYPTDPHAWVSDASELKAKASALGRTVSGAVNS